MITLRKKSSGTLIEAYCGTEDRIGTAVRISGVENSTITVTPVNPAYPAQMPAYGLLVRKITPTRCLVQRWGDVTLPPESVLEPGKVCYIGPDASLTTSQPAPDAEGTGVFVLQTMGHATGPTSVDFSPSPATLEISV